jgi:hypothetical protein
MADVKENDVVNLDWLDYDEKAPIDLTQFSDGPMSVICLDDEEDDEEDNDDEEEDVEDNDDEEEEEDDEEEEEEEIIPVSHKPCSICQMEVAIVVNVCAFCGTKNAHCLYCHQVEQMCERCELFSVSQ